VTHAIGRAVVLARGLGTRMRRDDPGAAQDAAQARVADTGLKAMIPIGRPFLDYVLSSLADAGLTSVCLVVGPEHQAVEDYYTRVAPPRRVHVEFAVQPEPRGTADAVRAARAWTGGDPFVALNSDNLYPVESLRALALATPPALAAFHRENLVRDGNIDPDRLAHFALLELSADGFIADLVEKPDPATFARLSSQPYVSMNSWAFDERIFDACERVPLSDRGELELPQAVRLAVRQLGARVRVICFDLPVLDLSRRRDIATVAAHLAAVTPDP